MRRQLGWGRTTAMAHAAALALLTACAGDRDQPSGEPSFYKSLAGPNVELDAATAASMISGYRGNNGLSAVEIDPGLMHRVAVIGAGTLDTLPHNGAVVTLLAVCGSTHRKSYFDILIAGIVGPILALIAVIALGSAFGSF